MDGREERWWERKDPIPHDTEWVPFEKLSYKQQEEVKAVWSEKERWKEKGWIYPNVKHIVIQTRRRLPTG